MTYHELFEQVKKSLTAVDASSVAEHVAVQVNVTGEAEGAFYIEIADGKLVTAPYDYVDRDFLLTADGADVLAVTEGTLSLQTGIEEGRIAVEGSYEKAMVLSSVLAQLPVKNAPEKKPAAKKTAAKKAVKTETAEASETPAEKPKRGRKPKAESAAKPTEKKTRTRKAAKKEA